MSDVPAAVRATRERLAAKPHVDDPIAIPDLPTPGEEQFCPRCGAPLSFDGCSTREAATTARRQPGAKPKKQEGRDQEALPLA